MNNEVSLLAATMLATTTMLMATLTMSAVLTMSTVLTTVAATLSAILHWEQAL